MSVRKRTWTTGKGEAKEAWVVDYTDSQGTRRLKTFAKKRAADTFAAQARVEVGQGTHVADSASITVADAAELWHTAVRNGRDGREPAEASTLRQYRTHIDLHIVPRIGKTKLSKLTAPTVASFRDELLESLSRPMARKVLVSLKGIVGEAQSRGLVGINAATSIKIGTGGRHKEEVPIPERKEVSVVIAKLNELATQKTERNAKAWRRWRAFMLTAIHSGLRASELRGLPWDDVDLKAGTIDVTQRADERGTLGPVKSGAGRRTVTIPATLVRHSRNGNWNARRVHWFFQRGRALSRISRTSTNDAGSRCRGKLASPPSTPSMHCDTSMRLCSLPTTRTRKRCKRRWGTLPFRPHSTFTAICSKTIRLKQDGANGLRAWLMRWCECDINATGRL